MPVMSCSRENPKTILEFIGRFRMAAGNSKEMVDCVDKLFTCGACYWFAEILYQRYCAGCICYDPIEGHFVWRYDGVYYDITGIYNKNIDKILPLGVIKNKDLAQYERLLRDCRNLNWEEEEELSDE